MIYLSEKLISVRICTEGSIRLYNNRETDVLAGDVQATWCL